jgi:nicotinamidase-related amidase
MMNIISEHKQAALLIIDMQNGVVANAYQRDQVIANINILIESARLNKVPVIWIQHSDEGLKENTESWQFVPELKRDDSELLIAKRFGDSFEDTQLEAELKRLKIKKVFVSGAQTDACIRATIHGAFVRGYDTTLVADAHTTEDLTEYGLPSPQALIDFTNIYWTWQRGPGRVALVVKTGEVRFDN